MEDIIKTLEDIQISILSAFDSVNLIIELNSLNELSEEQFDELTRNIDHLRIMMSHEWFRSELTVEQDQQITQLI